VIASEILEEQTTTEWVQVDKIDVDITYQRYLSPVKVKLIADKFDKNAVGVLITSKRDSGKIVVLDGQHRLEAMRKKGIISAECKVIRGLTIEQEAEIYIFCNVARKNPDALETFRARLIRREPLAVAIDNLVERCGLHIQFRRQGTSRKGRSVGAIWAVQALEKVYVSDRGGKGEMLEKVLVLINKSWPEQINTLEAKVILGVAMFHRLYEGRYTEEEFIARMKRTNIDTFIRRAKYHAEILGGSANTAFAKAIQEAYDKGRRVHRLVDKEP